jgi:hypothetical protein
MHQTRSDHRARLVAMVADGEMRLVSVTSKGLRFKRCRRVRRFIDFATPAIALILTLVALWLLAALH